MSITKGPRVHRRTSVVITRQVAEGLIVTSPVIRPTSPNSANISRYFWLLRAYKHFHWDVKVHYRDATTSLDGTRVNHTLFVFKTLRNSVLRHYGLSSAGVGRNQDTLISLNSMNRNLLEGIQCKLVFPCRFRWGNMGCYWHVWEPRGYCDLMPDLT